MPDETLTRLTQAALSHAAIWPGTEAFIVPTGVGDLYVALGTKEQIAKLLSDEGMTAYGGDD